MYLFFGRKRSQVSVKREGWAIVAGSLVYIYAGELVLWEQKNWSPDLYYPTAIFNFIIQS